MLVLWLWNSSGKKIRQLYQPLKVALALQGFTHANQWRNHEQFLGGASQNFILNMIKTSTPIIRVANFLNTVNFFFTITEGLKKLI
jgi:hypothetical protein